MGPILHRGNYHGRFALGKWEAGDLDNSQPRVSGSRPGLRYSDLGNFNTRVCTQKPSCPLLDIALTWHNRYCHVWKISTNEYKYFRLPLAHFIHHVSHGSKVLLSYEGSVVHFCFDSGMTRTVKTGMVILFVSLHPSEDQFSIISPCNTSGEEVELRREFPLRRNDHNLQAQKYSVHNNELVCSWMQHQELPFHEDGWKLQRGPYDLTLYRECLHPSQSSSLLWSHMHTSTGLDFHSTHLSLEANDQISVHFTPREKVSNATSAYLDHPGQGSGLVYRHESRVYGQKFKLYIGSECSTRSYVSSDTNALQFNVKRKLNPPPIRDCYGVVGDRDFVLFYSLHDDIWIWCFDETWDPSGVPGINLDI
jgi:hypothetical protein